MSRPVRGITRQTLLIVVVATIALASWYFVRQGGETASVRVPGQDSSAAVTSSQLPDLNGKQTKISDWKGKVVVVNFWATWCAPCREEIPALVRIQHKFGAKGVQVVGIALDDLARVKPFSIELGVNYPLLIAGLDGLELVRLAGNEVGALPFTVFIDRSGRIVKAELGGVNDAKLENLLLPLL
ncbi:MAG: TlpA family protein disulfide reductase [Betaproteobacteria bacterium]|nr:TlpA family protein disulfide reductase [Betaproteobacteria bacterium]